MRKILSVEYKVSRNEMGNRKEKINSHLRYLRYRRYMNRYIESLCCFSYAFSEPDNEVVTLVDWYLLI